MSKTIELSPTEYVGNMPTKPRVPSDWEVVINEEISKRMSLRSPIVLGLLTLVFGVGGFFYWASNSEISAASVAAGKVVVASSTKTVTLLESARLKQLVVSEGDLVLAGAVLATLDSTRSQSSLDQLVQSKVALEVRLQRLFAERDERNDVEFASPSRYPGQASILSTIVATELRLFQERNQLYKTQIEVEQANIQQVQSQSAAIGARRETVKLQLDLLGQQIGVLTKLAAKSLATKSELSQKQIQDLELKEKLTQLEAEQVTNAQKIAQFQLSIANVRNQHFREIVEQIQATQIELNKVNQDLISAEDVVSKAIVKAPQTGKVANIRIKTSGSAIIGGQPFLDIVPTDQKLIIEGKVRAADIDTVTVGMKTEIKLQSFGSSEAFPLVGKITYVAADAVTDERNGEVTFLFRAEINPGEIEKQSNLFLYPGMQADVYIVNGQRSALTYLIEPIEKSFNRAFREQ